MQNNQKDNFQLKSIVLDGNKINRTLSCTAANAANGQNLRITSTTSNNAVGFQMRKVLTKNARCGSGAVIAAEGFTIQNSNSIDNGFRKGDLPGGTESFADGFSISCHGSTRSAIQFNLSKNNTDVDIVSGGGVCDVKNNTVSHTTQHAFAGLHLGWFDQPLNGNHDTAKYEKNSVTTTKADRLDIGIGAGFHPWNVNVQTQKGSVTGNTIIGAFVNLLVDGHSNSTITGNTLGATRDGQRDLFPNCFLTGDPPKFTVGEGTGNTLQSGYITMYFHGGTCCTTLPCPQ